MGLHAWEAGETTFVTLTAKQIIQNRVYNLIKIPKINKTGIDAVATFTYYLSFY